MADMIEYFKNVNLIFWGDDVYQWWFYLSILIILILEKRIIVKRIFGIYPVCFLIALFTPLTYKIVQKVAVGWQYYARLYSMLPIPYTLALASILLMEWVSAKTTIAKKTGVLIQESADSDLEKSPLLKLSITICLIALIIFGGTSVYDQDWMQKAENIMKVPNEVFWLSQTLHHDEDITVAVPDSLVCYARQVDAGIYMPYGRDMNTLGLELSKECPDPNYVMEEAGREACDYIVIRNNQQNVDSFLSKGWEPYAKTETYLVFEVKGISRVKNIYDNKHRLKRITSLDATGSPTASEKGYTSICYEYDRDNNRILEYYLDENDEPYTTSRGYTAVQTKYTLFSHWATSIMYLDVNNKPVYAEGYGEKRLEYGRNQRLQRESYYDEKGEPMLLNGRFYASRVFTYNATSTEVIGEKYYDTEGKLCINNRGYAEYRRTLNDYDQIIQETYYDTNGNRTRSVKGYAELRREYDDRHNLIKETYWDKQGNPTTNNDGYFGFVRIYDEAGQLSEEKYLLEPIT